MERKRIYLCLAHMSDEGLEQKYIKEAFDTNWVVPLGPNVNAFEQELERFVNNQYPITRCYLSGWWRCRRVRRRCIWDC